MNYQQLLLDTFEVSDKEEVLDPYNDYCSLVNMMNSGKYDKEYVDFIYMKYKKEIDRIDKLRSSISNINGINPRIPKSINDSLDILLDHLIAIMGLRFIKDKANEYEKEQLAYSSYKIIYEVLAKYIK
jgi:hypothetical protein